MSQSIAQPMLDIHALYKSFNGVKVLDNINLRVMPGELIFLIGPSGSGKSTLLRCCNRLEEPSDGAIVVDGVNITAVATDINKMRQRIGMVFQQFNLFPHLTARERGALARGGQGHEEGRGPATGPRDARQGGTGREVRRLPRPAQRRPAAARGHRPGPGHAAQGAAVRRDHLGAGPGAGQRSAGRGQAAGHRGHDAHQVTHEMRFARDVGDQLVFMHQGRVHECGPAKELFANPSTPELAGFIGAVQ